MGVILDTSIRVDVEPGALRPAHVGNAKDFADIPGLDLVVLPRPGGRGRT